MAVTSIWPIKSGIRAVIEYARNPEKTTERSRENLSALHTINGVVEYAADALKTEQRAYVTCLNCDSEETAAREFMEVKESWKKKGGRQCFHGYQSFRAGEVDAETAHAIGVELARRMWGEDFQVLVATHCNTGHYHSHFVVNSVSFIDGHHFDNRLEDYQRFRDLSDQLCREYGLSTIETPRGHGKSYAEYEAEKNGKPTYRGMIRADIDRAVAASLTRDEFFRFLMNAGYTLKLYKKDGDWLEYPALKPPGAKGFFRFHKLGKGYELYEIDERILNNLRRQVPFPEAEQEEVKRTRAETPPPFFDRRSSGLYRLYLRYCYELHIIEKHPASAKRVSFFLREDLAKLDRLDAETRLLASHKLESYEELRGYQEEAKKQIERAEEKRAELRRALRGARRRMDAAEAERLGGALADCGKQIRSLRKEVSLCDDIALRSAQTREELEWLLEQQERDAREEESRRDSNPSKGKAPPSGEAAMFYKGR